MRILYLLLVMIVSCGKSYDFGDRESYEVRLTDADMASPQWGYPVYDIVRTKCANCHTPYRDQFVPKNTPVEFDEILNQGFFTTNKSIIRARVLDANNPMPPDFGTPLSSRERTALINYLNTL